MPKKARRVNTPTFDREPEMIRETYLLLSYFNVSGTLPLSHAGFLIFVNTHDTYQ